MTQLLANSGVDAMSLRPRQLRKRHSIMTHTPADWQNPCGGVYLSSVSSLSRHPTVRRVAYNLLRKHVRNTYSVIVSEDKKAIDISNIDIWSGRKRDFDFLPKLKRTSGTALKRWHRHMQTYVASLGYLHNIQRKVDDAKFARDRSVSRELSDLLNHARSILCELESTINRTTSSSEDRGLKYITAEDMNKHLRFGTKKLIAEGQYMHVDEVDLKFVKHRFVDYVRKMWTILRHQKTRTASAASAGADSNASTSDSNSSGYASSKSVNSLETNQSRNHRLGGKKKRPVKKPRRRQNILNNPIDVNSSQSAAISSNVFDLTTT